MTRSARTFVLLSMVVGPIASVIAGTDTLTDIARRNAPRPVLIERMRELIPARLDEVSARADLIVYGVVELVRTYLSEDGRELLTDYRVTPRRVLRQRSVEATERPGMPAPIVVTRWGGRMEIEGTEVVLRDYEAPPFEESSEYLLYLTESPMSDGTYVLASEVTGVLSVVDGQVRLPAQDQAYGEGFDRMRGASVDTLETEVAAPR